MRDSGEHDGERVSFWQLVELVHVSITRSNKGENVQRVLVARLEPLGEEKNKLVNDTWAN